MQSKIPHSLHLAFANKTLIPLVGAGVSMSLRKKNGGQLFPSWNKLLAIAAEELKKEDKTKLATAIEVMLELGKYGEAAQLAREGLLGAQWGRFFTRIFDVARSEIDDSSLALPEAIWKLSNRLITLNYDRTMRFACPDLALSEIDNKSLDSLASFSRAETSNYTVWHMHGWVDKPSDIIFTSESYSAFYSNKNQEYLAALKIFQSVCRDSQLLFIGCSLDDADLLRQMAEQHELFNGSTGPHYALVKESDAQMIQQKLGNLPVHLITFPDFGESLIALINEMAGINSDTKKLIHNTAESRPKSNLVKPQSKKIAILVAEPIGKKYEYSVLLHELKKFKADITLMHLNKENLNELNGYSYIFILSKMLKSKIAIEDDALNTTWLSIKELEDSIGNEDTQGVFLFLDHKKKTSLDESDISKLVEPIFIFPALTKSQAEGLSFKIFKKNAFDYVEESLICNAHRFRIEELKTQHSLSVVKTLLPLSIDARTTKDYVGRITDLENLCRKIIGLRETSEFLTIKGSGGLGKTITAKKVIVELAARHFYSDGIDFIDCEFIQDYQALEDKIARSFDLDNAINVLDQISQKCGTQNRLIILDNMESLLHLESSDEIRGLIDFICVYATVIITSREVLGLDSEQVYELRAFTTDEAYQLFKNQLPWYETIEGYDVGVIRSEILENLLDNNPLAIKLVTKNMPKGKSFPALRKELESNIFQKVSISELEAFDGATDLNIERKKSLYGSINFSYQYLDEKEKVAFELLSLFPDGINLESLKRISKENKSLKDARKKPVTETSLITDSIIKALDNKSLVQIDNNKIKLQSIIGKFAELKLNLRQPIELRKYYKNAFDYNYALSNGLRTYSSKNPLAVANILSSHQNNFVKSIQYIKEIKYDSDAFFDYLDDLHFLITAISAGKALTKAFEAEKFSFPTTIEQLCFDIYMLSIKYYDGEFAYAYEELKRIMPLQEVEKLDNNDFLNMLTKKTSLHLYSLEGEVLASAKNEILRNKINRFYPQELFQLGYLNTRLLATCGIDFFAIEMLIYIGEAKSHMIDEYIVKSIHEKSHLDATQVWYLKAKISKVGKQAIHRLVAVNPYTQGLKFLMLAFVEEDPINKTDFFENALKSMTHIKYYYVEALYFYAEFLKVHGDQSKFKEIYDLGVGLATKHHYRYQLYKYEKMMGIRTEPYKIGLYSLPDDFDNELDKYATQLMKA